MDEEGKFRFRRGSGARRIGSFAQSMLDPVARARGFATTDLFSQWAAIAGADLASFTQPDKIIWPRRTGDPETATPQSAYREDGAILVLKVDGPRAIELQHKAEQILERANRYFGYRAISQLRFLQAPIRRERDRPPSSPEPDAPSLVASEIEEEGLRQALQRLGSRVRGKMRT